MSLTNSSSISINPALLIAPFQLNIWLGLSIFITGNLSCLGNFLVFSSRTFRSQACSIYLIVESMSTFFYFNYVLLTRIIQKGFQYPIINRYDVVCKIRQFLSEYTHQVAFTLFTCATIDRYLSTHRSPAYRKWSNRVSYAYKMAIVISIIWFLLIGHRLILYNTSHGTCQPIPGIYEKFDSYFEVIMSGLCPPIVLITLGYLLLKNVRKISKNQVIPIGITIQQQPRYIQQVDLQLTRMVLLQSFIAIPSFIPFGLQNLYTSIALSWYKPPLYQAWENIIVEVIRLFSYVFYSTSFYVSFLSSRGFRQQILYSLKIKRDSNNIADSTQRRTQTNIE